MDQENWKRIAEEAGQAIAQGASEAAGAATRAAESAGEKLSEFGHRAAEWGKEGFAAVAPQIVQLAERAEADAKNLAERTKEAVERNEEISMGNVAELAHKGSEALFAASEALAEVEKHAARDRKKKGRFGRVVGWGLLAVGVGAVGYLMWRRSRPVEDPWAEEYWVDLQNDAENLGDDAEKFGDKVKDAAEDLGGRVKDAADQALKTAKGAAGDIKDDLTNAKDSVGQAAGKAKETAEDIVHEIADEVLNKKS